MFFASFVPSLAVAPKEESLVNNASGLSNFQVTFFIPQCLCSLLTVNLFTVCQHIGLGTWSKKSIFFCLRRDFAKILHLSYYFGMSLWQIIGFSLSPFFVALLTLSLYSGEWHFIRFSSRSMRGVTRVLCLLQCLRPFEMVQCQKRRKSWLNWPKHSRTENS